MGETCRVCRRQKAHTTKQQSQMTYCSEDQSCYEYAAGYEAGRREGIDEGVRLAKGHTRVVLYRLNDVSSDFTATWNWTDVDEAAAAAKGER